METFKFQPAQASGVSNNWEPKHAVASPRTFGGPWVTSGSLPVRQHVETAQAVLGPRDYADIDSVDVGSTSYELHLLTSEVVDQARQRIEDLEIAVRQSTEMHARAIDELLQHCVVQTDDINELRRQLFQMYRQGLITKADVRKRGDLDPAEFHEEMLRLGREARALAG